MEHTLRKRFGDRVRALRQTTGLSQEAFADRCGFARSYMSRIERGKGNPSLDAIEVLAVALQVAAYELFLENNNTAPTTSRPTAPTVLVPYAADGSCFHPGLRMPRSNRYHVGPKSAEQTFDEFEEALAYLKTLDVACWRRPNAAGHWGSVKAVSWDKLRKLN